MNDEFSFDIKKERPEDIYEKVADYFSAERIRDYSFSKNMQKIQTKITARALELLNLEQKNALLLDAGCGPGFASFFIKELGYKVVAFDIISQFFNYFKMKDINHIVADMCNPPFKPETFNGIISISALQWIYRDISNNTMENNFIELITSFYTILKFNSKIVFQFYPKNSKLMDKMKALINSNTEFDGGFVIDNPNNPKKRKIFLILEKVK
jgi:SAM-dependent methyltransferase